MMPLTCDHCGDDNLTDDTGNGNPGWYRCHCGDLHQPIMITIFSVTGYHLEDGPDAPQTVLMASPEEAFPARSDLEAGASADARYFDEDIYFYGVSAASLQQAVETKESLGDFIPVSFEVEDSFEPGE
jgi:hypothetical protein